MNHFIYIKYFRKFNKQTLLTLNFTRKKLAKTKRVNIPSLKKKDHKTYKLERLVAAPKLRCLFCVFTVIFSKNYVELYQR